MITPSKLPQVGTTIFTLMSKMAQDFNAINLSQGFPDFDCPERLRELVNHHLNNNKNQYPPMAGIPQLRQQIAVKVESTYNYLVNPETEITITSGATEALFDAVQAVIHPGDEVIVFDPAYDSYEPAVIMAGGKTIHIPLTPDNYGIDWQHLKDAINSKTRLIIINSPHNPSGSTLSRQDLNLLADLIRDTNILILSDEVYEHMVFDNEQHQSVLRHEELAQKSFAVFSFGKTYHATGWKLAYCVAPAPLTQELRKVHQFVTFTSTSFLQYALADYLGECPQHALNLPSFYQSKRDYFCKGLEATAFTFTPTKGTYFQLVNYSAISELPDTEFCNKLTQEIGVAAIPLSPFHQQTPSSKQIRFCFCKEESTLDLAIEKLATLKTL